MSPSRKRLVLGRRLCSLLIAPPQQSTCQHGRDRDKFMTSAAEADREESSTTSVHCSMKYISHLKAAALALCFHEVGVVGWTLHGAGNVELPRLHSRASISSITSTVVLRQRSEPSTFSCTRERSDTFWEKRAGGRMRRKSTACPHSATLKAADAEESAGTTVAAPDSAKSGHPAKSQSQRGTRGARTAGKGKAGGDGNQLQSVDFTTALLMSRELGESVVPARIENAYQLDPYNLALNLRTLERSMWLHVCWHPKGARCNVGKPPPREKEQKAYTFSHTLRSLIRGLNIVAVGLARPFERVVRLDLAPRLDTPPTFRMYVEIMASRSNVILVAVDYRDAETVAACAYQVSPNKSVRPLSTGQPYELPPAMTGRRPSLEESLEDFIEGVGRVPTQQLKKALVAVYQGTSPMLVSVMASQVQGLTPATKVGDITPERWHAFFSGPWRRWVELIGDGGTPSSASSKGNPVTVEESSDEPSGDESSSRGGDAGEAAMTRSWISKDGNSYYPTTLAERTYREDLARVAEGEIEVTSDEDSGPDVGGDDDSRGSEGTVEGFTSLQEVMETYYRATQSNEEFDGLRRRCMSRVTATLVKLRERVADFEHQLVTAEEDKICELNLRGDLLTTYAHNWVQGDAVVECEDFDTGERITIEVKSDKTPIEMAQSAYKLGKKLKRSASVVRELLEQAQAQVLYAEGIEMALDQLRGGDREAASSREELAVLRGIAEELGLLGGAEAVRKFAGAFGVKQVQSGGASGSETGKRSGNSRNKLGAKGRKTAKSSKKGHKNGAGGGSGGSKDSSAAGLLELRREPDSPAVLVGRNNLQNERITFSVAKAHELWFHARGVAGAHVLLRLQPGQDADDSDLAFAADVAAYFSKGRQSASTPVDYMSPKGVKKMGGGGPGMVKYDGADVVRGEPSRVEALVKETMQSREEEAAR